MTVTIRIVTTKWVKFLSSSIISSSLITRFDPGQLWLHNLSMQISKSIPLLELLKSFANNCNALFVDGPANFKSQIATDSSLLHLITVVLIVTLRSYCL